MLGGEGAETVWVETLPVIPVSEEYDRDAPVAQLPNDLSRFLVSRDIPLHEINIQIIQSLLGEFTGVACRRGEDCGH